MKNLYTAKAKATNGREGHAETDDGVLKLDLSPPGAPNAKPGSTNPEQLFACGYAACFGGAIAAVARKKGVKADATVNSEVSLNQDDNGGYFLAVKLKVEIAGMDKAAAQELVDAAHQVCPYSKATRGNIDVQVEAI